jgi:outer membrane protein assembly factor BamB
MLSSSRRFLLLALLFSAQGVSLVPKVCAGDWPQILGPARDGHAVNEKLAAAWPATGPRKLWERPVGQGYAGVAVAAGRVYVFHRQGDQELVECLAAETGAPLWKREFDAQYSGGIDPDKGPRCVPLVVDGQVVVLGAAGGLRCLATEDGSVRWQRDLLEDFRADEGYFGFGSTPLAVGDRLLVNVGGKKDAGIVAFSLADGSTLWQATNDGASYSSPTLTKVGGQPLAVFATRLNAVGIAPDTGKIVFRFPFGMRGPTVNAATPLVFRDQAFFTANYGVGALLARLEPGGATTIWESGDALSSQYPTPIYLDGHLYGIDGREDVGRARLRCVEASTGKVMWTEPNFGMAHAILADGKLVLQKTSGELLLVEPTPRAYRLLAQAPVFKSEARSLPALSNGRLFARDTDTLACFDLR